MKLLTLAAALLLAGPAAAQSFYPNTYGQRFCELRRRGIDDADARRIAMQDAWSRYRQPSYVNYQGKQTNVDILDAANYIVNNCRELIQ